MLSFSDRIVLSKGKYISISRTYSCPPNLLPCLIFMFCGTYIAKKICAESTCLYIEDFLKKSQWVVYLHVVSLICTFPDLAANAGNTSVCCNWVVHLLCRKYDIFSASLQICCGKNRIIYNTKILPYLLICVGVGGAVRFLVVGTIGQGERPPRGLLWMEQCLASLKYWPI